VKRAPESYRGPGSHVLTREENSRGGSSRSDAKRSTSAANGLAWLERFRQTEASERATHRGGLAATALVYVCECGRVICGPSAFNHANAAGHAVARQDTHDSKETA
jgi:hypothetical protein